jgi:serine/threonine protein kinase
MAVVGNRWWGPRSDFPWEEDALRHVHDQMPTAEPYRAWHTFTFTARTGHVRELDLLIAAPGGLFLVEIKSHPGHAANRGSTWLFRGGDKLRTIENPLHLTDRKCKELKAQLEWAAHELGLHIRLPYIQPAVFLSAPDLRCDFDEVQRTHVYGRDQLSAQTGLPGIWTGLLGAPPRSAASRIDAVLSRQLSKLLDKVGIQGLRRQYRIAGYQLEPRAFDTGPTWEDYLAENTALPGDDPRRVRIYLSDRDAPREQREWARRAARREYLALQGISHDGIVRAEQFSDEHDAGPAIIFRHGRDWQRLDYFMAESGARLPVETRVEMVRQLAEALDHAHRRHLYHRALAARSVYVELDGYYPRLRICDWQVSARPGGTSSPHTALASARATMLGGQVEPSVAAYLAPEFGNPDSDATLLDVFGLGALTYLVLTGQPPASSAADLASRLASERALAPSAVADQLSPAMDDLVKGATSAAPSDRVESVREFLGYLDLVDEELTRPDQDEIPDLLMAGKGTKMPDGWEVQQVLGKGSTARALLMTKDGHERVYKVALTEAARTRLEHEAAQLGPLQDSHIVRLITGPVAIGQRTALILDRAGEQTVGQYLRSQGRFPIDDLESLGRQLFQVTEFLESEGVWHRDIKPDNLAIRQPPKKGRRLVLFDFSLADTNTRVTQAGTPPYLDPFLGNDRRPEFDSAAERYSIAVTLHEMASGELPSWGDGVVEPRLLDSSEQLPQLAEDAFDPRLRDRLVDFFSAALQRDATRRHSSLAEMAKGWTDVFRDLDQTARPATTPGTVDASTATAAEARDLSAARVDARTPLVAAGLSARALSAAEDQLHVNTVGELVRIPAARVQRLRGVGLGPRNELVKRAREWRQQLQVAEQAQQSPGVRAGGVDPAMLSLDEVATQLVPRPAEGNGAEVLVIRLALGLPDADGRPAPVPAWAPISEIAAHAELPPEYVSELLARARTRWTKSLPAVTRLRITAREILEQHGRVLESRHLAAALLADRGCALADDGARLAVAQACLRAAIVTEEHLENPRLARRRIGGGKVLIASVAEDDPSVPNEEELFDYAAELGRAADQLVSLTDGAPLPGSATARQRLSAVRRPDGMPVPADTDLMALAVGASAGAAMTARLELYPRTLSPARALQLSQAASYLAPPGIEPEKLRQRVLTRFPDLAYLPPAPDLRQILKDLGYRVEVVTSDGRPRFETPGGTLVAAWSSTRGPTSLSRPGDAGADAETRTRLTAAAECGGFLTVKTWRADAVAVTAQIAALDGVTAVPVAKLFVAALREIVAGRGRPRWEAVLAADSADAPSTAQAGLRRLMDEAWERIGAQVRAVPGIAFLYDATPLARYPGGRELLTRLASAARQSDEAPLGLWLLCPMQDPRRPALLDQHIVGALGDGEQVVVRPSAPPPAERRAS